MRILLLIHHFPPDVNSTGLLMSQIFAKLAEEGHEVSVISTFPHYEGFRTWPQYRRKIFERSTHEGMNVTRVYSYTSGTKTMRRRLANYLSFNLFALLAGLFRRGTYDLVFCTNGSFFSGVTGWLIARAKRARCVYNLQDLYPEVPVAQGQLKGRRSIKMLAAIEWFMYKRADHLVVITAAFRENLRDKGVSLNKVSIIPNFVDTEFITPLPKENEFSSKHGFDEKFLISHAGNIGYVYDLGTLLEAAHALRDQDDILFLIVGDGVARGELERKAKELELPNVRFMGFRPVEELPLLRAASDLQLSLYKSGSATYSMPSKVYEIMASGRPLLASADPDSDIRRLVESVGCGVCVTPGDPDALIDAIKSLFEDPAARESMGKRGRAEAETSYSLSTVTGRYRHLFEQMATKN
ncbi:MAG: glycosyltransferase family 4 protein [Actinomycetota bacterium]|nr:glycosyltransferase family 4 protein [Actinomycetota bacterium]